MELFLLMARHESARGVRAATIRLIVDHLYLVDENFRDNPRVLSLFLELLRQRRGIYTQLQRMNRYGLLARFIPAFGQIVGRMQFDLFHVYTVDQHILFTVRNLRRFAYGKYQDTFPHVTEVFERLQRPELLYLAALFHDIAKGRGGDHSELGAADARDFCASLPLAEEERELVAWLVEQHLLMSQTSQKKDIGDPETVIEFTRVVNTRSRLDHLYLLTVADIAATSPRLWNSWKSGLLRELYRSARDALERDPEHWLDRQETIEASRDSVREALIAEDLLAEEIDTLWKEMPGDLFLRLDDSQLAWASAEALRHRGEQALVALRHRKDLGVTEVLVYAADYTGLFATTTAVLDELGLNVLSARVVTTGGRRSFDVFQLMDRHGQLLDPVDAERLVSRLTRALDARVLRQPLERPVPRRLRAFRKPTKLTFRSARGGSVTEVEVECSDRPGILSQLAAAMVSSGVRIHDALISTLGDRVEDVFLVTDRDNRPLDAGTQELLAREIDRRLASKVNG
jgi:[protein-PII] uridylyltransferase